MEGFGEFFIPPFVACLVLAGIHAYLGIHVVMREVIFVDIALAQIAALGTTVAFLLGFHEGEGPVYWIALGTTLLGAGILALTRSRRHHRVPQEAIIGLIYAGSAALGILLAVHLEHGGLDHIKRLMAGNLALIVWKDVVPLAALYAAIGAVHVFCRRPFLEISRDPDVAFRSGRRVRAWDFLFYATFGIVVTSSVQLAGVLLVFAYLIAPAVIGVMFADGVRARLLVGWTAGGVATASGLLYAWHRGDIPYGPAVVCALVLLVFLAMIAVGIVRRSR